MPSTTHRRHRMRCYACRKKGRSGRFTLKRPLSEYRRAVRCPVCGSTHLQDCEASRRRELAKQNTCRCDGAPFRHREGSIRTCLHHPLADTPLTFEEEMDTKAMFETPRRRWDT